MQFLSHDLRDRVDRLCEWVFEPDYHRESATFRRERFLQGLVVGSACLHESLARVLGPHYSCICKVLE